MTGGGYGTGSDGSSFNGDSQEYPGVPYGSGDFNGASECSTDNLEIQASIVLLNPCKYVKLNAECRYALLGCGKREKVPRETFSVFSGALRISRQKYACLLPRNARVLFYTATLLAC
jgi:hypothetical protein